MQNNSITQKERLMMAKDIFAGSLSNDGGCLNIKDAFGWADDLISYAGFIVEGKPEPAELHSMD